MFDLDNIVFLMIRFSTFKGQIWPERVYFLLLVCVVHLVEGEERGGGRREEETERS